MGYVIIWVQIDRVQGYDEDQIALVVLDLANINGLGIPSPPALLLNRPIRGLLPQRQREPLNIHNGDAQYEALKQHQNKYVKDNDTVRDSTVFAVQCEDRGLWTHRL